MDFDCIIQTWIENADTTPKEIGLEEATDWFGYFEPEEIKEFNVTPELIRDTWNRLIKGE